MIRRVQKTLLMVAVSVCIASLAFPWWAGLLPDYIRWQVFYGGTIGGAVLLLVFAATRLFCR